MNNKLTKTIVLGLVVVLVMSLGAAAVFAQDDTTPDSDAQPTLPEGRGGHHGRGDRGGANEEALAAELGITVDELQAARQQMMVDRLAQAVEDGSLTQDEANTRLAMQALKEYIDKEAIMAQVLGMTAEEFEAAREEGSIRDNLADITPADLQARMHEATQAAVERAVAENAITQEQADLVLEKLEEGLGNRGSFGGQRGSGGGRGGFRGAPTAPETEEAGVLFTPFGA